MTRRRVVVGGAILLVAAAAIGWWMSTRKTNTVATAVQQTSVVRRGSIRVTVEATGKLAAADDAALAFAGGGTVADVLAKVGDTVSAGRPIAVLDTTALELEAKAAKASHASAQSALASARASLAELKAGPTAEDLERAKIQLEKAKDSRWSVQLRRDAACGKVENKRAEQVECDSAEASVLSAEDDVRLAELDYQAALAGATASELNAAQDKVRQAESQLAQAQNQAAQAELQLDQAALTSPISGTLTSLALKKGERVAAGTPVGTVSNLEGIEVQITLDQTDVARVKSGQPAEVKVDAFPAAKLSGEVTDLAFLGETQSGVVLYPVTIGLAPSRLGLRPGMTADATIIISTTDEVLIVPRRAVQTSENRHFVQVRTDAGTRRVPVTLGATSDTEAEVSGQLAAGDTVVYPTTGTTGVTTRASGSTTGTSGSRQNGGFRVPGLGGGLFGGAPPR